MYGSTLCLGLIGGTNVHGNEQIKIISAAGFDGFFSAWTPNIFGYKDLANDLGMIYQSIHAPFNRADKIWHDGDEADSVRNELLKCVEDCARLEVPILVVHPYAGVPKCDIPPESGIENYSTVISRAEQLGVKIAFENVSQPIYLNALMTAFKNSDNVGFCFDTGHEMCYSVGKDQLSPYADRLIATHINDNLGKTKAGTPVTWHDDLHLLPFDGIINWQKVADRLNECGYNGILSFELNKNNRPNRFDNEKYVKMSLEEYVAEAYARACRFAYMKNGF
jgi:sugar phosphate isomerase/epimerase